MTEFTCSFLEKENYASSVVSWRVALKQIHKKLFYLNAECSFSCQALRHVLDRAKQAQCDVCLVYASFFLCEFLLFLRGVAFLGFVLNIL